MSTVKVAFSVPFVAGKERHRTTSSGHTYTPKATEERERAVWDAYARSSVRVHGEVMSAPKGAPVSVGIVAYDALPVSRPKGIISEPYTVKPDVDNLAKLILDGLNPKRGGRRGAWAVDAQVTQVLVTKCGRLSRRRRKDRSDDYLGVPRWTMRIARSPSPLSRWRT